MKNNKRMKSKKSDRKKVQVTEIKYGIEEKVDKSIKILENRHNQTSFFDIFKRKK